MWVVTGEVGGLSFGVGEGGRGEVGGGEESPMSTMTGDEDRVCAPVGSIAVAEGGVVVFGFWVSVPRRV